MANPHSSSSSSTLYDDIVKIDEKKSNVLRGHSGSVCCVCISCDNKRIASGGDRYDATIRLWEIDSNSNNWKEVRIMSGHTYGILRVSFAGVHDEFIISCSRDKTAICWRVENGEKVHVFEGHTHAIYDLLLLPNRSSFATASWDKPIRIWSITTGQQMGMVDTKEYCYSLALSNDNRHIVSGHGYPNYIIMVWDATPFTLPSGNNNSNSNNSNSNDNTVTGNNSLKKINTITTSQSSAVWRLCYSKNDKYLASGSYDFRVNIYNAGNDGYAVLKTLRGHSNTIESVTFIGDVLISGSGDSTMKFWDVEKGECIKTITKHTEPVFDVAVSSDNKVIVSGSSDKTIGITYLKDEIDTEEWFGDVKNAGKKS